MNWLPSVVSGLLAGIFTVSGVSKLSRPYQAALALRNFRVANRVRPGAGRLVGVIEVAAALAVTPGFWAGYVPAALLLAIFTVLIARSLARGEHFACNCFGEHGGELTAFSLLRSAGLLIIAGAGGLAAYLKFAPHLGFPEHVLGLCTGVCLAAGAFAVAGLVSTAPFSKGLSDA